MKKVILLGAGLLLLCCFSAEKASANNRFSLQLGVTPWTVPTNEIKTGTSGGKIGYIFSFGYCFVDETSYFRPSIGLGLKKISLKGKDLLFEREPEEPRINYYTTDWHWTNLLFFGKLEIGNDKFIPYGKIGIGLCHLNLDYFVPRGSYSVSEDYFGLSFELGLKWRLNLMNTFLFGEAGYDITPKVSPPIDLDRKVKSAEVVQFSAGLGFSF